MDDLIRYRLISAKEKLTSAKLLLDAGLYKDSVGRSYYSIFSSMRAVLAIRQVDFSKHAGVISYFQKEYIKTNIFDKKYSKYIQQAFQIRNGCDYDDFFYRIQTGCGGTISTGGRDIESSTGIHYYIRK